MVKVGFDDSGREAFLASNERAFKRSSERIAASERRIHRGSAFSGGQNAAYRVGLLSQQAQDVAVSLQMGMSASRVIAQQGSQISSIFGPQGMVIGGVIAIGAAIYEWAAGTREAEEAAQRYKKTQDEIAEIAKSNARQFDENTVAMTQMKFGSVAASLKSQELEFKKKQTEIEEKRNEVKANLAEKIRNQTGGWKWGMPDFDTSATDAKRQLMALDDEEYLLAQKINIERTESARKRNTEADLAIIKSQQEIALMSETSEEGKRSLKDYYDFKNRLSEIDMSDQSEFNKALLSQEAENLYEAKRKESDELANQKVKKENAHVFLEIAKEEVKLTERKIKAEKEASEFRDTDVQKYQRAKAEVDKLVEEIGNPRYNNATPEKQAELAEKRLALLKHEQGAVREIEAIRAEGMEFQKAGLAGTDAQNKRKVLEMEMDLLKKKIAFSPLEAQQIANRLELIRREQVKENFEMGAMGGAGMGAFNRKRKAEELARDRAEQRALGNLGLIGIERWIGGEIIGGVDPITGKKLSKQEIEQRRADMEAEKMRRELERKAAAGDKQAKDRLERTRWAGQQNDGKIAAGFTDDQIAALSKGVADAVLQLIAQ